MLNTVPGITPALTTPSPLCPIGYTLYWFGCYRLHAEATTWTLAAQLCASESVGGSLVSIHSSPENAFVQLFMDTLNEPVWIGLRFDQVGIAIAPRSPHRGASGTSVCVILAASSQD